MTDPSSPSLTRGRLYILLAAVLWSLSGGFSKLLTRPTGLGLEIPELTPMQIACGRAFFAALVLVPTLRGGDFSFRPMMVVMVLTFTVMNVLFVSALTLGTAANATLLQYTAPMWMFLASVWWLGEKADARSFKALLVGLGGITLIVLGGWQQADLLVIAFGLGSGLTYAGVLICLRVLRNCSASWLTVLNHLCGALVLLPLVWGLTTPRPAQWLVLFLFGAVQMGIPYLLMARGLKAVSPQEAGTITLLEPILNPIWAYAVAGEKPDWWTALGGACILGALAWRYWPGGVTSKAKNANG